MSSINTTGANYNSTTAKCYANIKANCRANRKITDVITKSIMHECTQALILDNDFVALRRQRFTYSQCY